MREVQSGRGGGQTQKETGARNPTAGLGLSQPATATASAGATPDEPPTASRRIPITVPVSTAHCPGLKLKSPNRVRGITRGAALSEAARHKRLKEIGFHQTRGTLREHLLSALKEDQAKCDVTIIRTAPAHFDDDNYIGSCKWLRDGIATAFGVADNHPNITFWYSQIHGKPREYGVTIEYRFTRKT